MTKKDFEATAAIIKGRFEFLGKANGGMGTIDFDRGFSLATEMIANDFAEHFEEVNPRFNRKMFLDACGLGE